MARIPINLSTGTIDNDSQKSESVIVGIDLGTTNSLVAYINDGKPYILTENGMRGLVPSIIHFAKNGTIVVGSEAKEKLSTAPERTIYSAKRLMGKSIADLQSYTDQLGYEIVGNSEDESKLLQVKIDDKYYNPIQLSSKLLAELKRKAEVLLGATVDKAVVTVPAYFNDAQRQATRDAGKLAGLDILRIINEPTAASLAYGAGLKMEDSENVVVYDLGGGTFDVSILYIDKGIFEVLSTHGDTFLGGDDIDDLIVNYWKANLNLTIESYLLKPIAEAAKKELSSSESTSIKFEDKELTLNRTEFDEIIQPLIDKTLDSCQTALTDSKLEKSAIDKVIFVGGSSRIPSIKEKVGQFFGKAVYDQINPDEVVALGAAIQADILAGNRKDLLLIDITPLSLGIETVGGVMDSIIARNSKVPTRVARNYTTSVDGQTKLRVTVYQGERDLVANNRKLGEVILTDIPPMAAGIPKIEIQFLLDANGVLTVKATEERSNTQTSIKIQSQYGITDEEMGKMLLESIQNAESDLKERSNREAVTEGRMVYNSNIKFVKQNESWLSDEEIATLQELNAKLDEAINEADKDTINQKLEDLNHYSRPLAEKALDKVVEANLSGKSLND